MQAQIFILPGLDQGNQSASSASELTPQTARPLATSMEICPFSLLELFHLVEIAVKIRSVTSRVKNRIILLSEGVECPY